MSDRTWNAVDARLYEECWSSEAKIIAGVLLARCPNQYGVFEFPYWFMQILFKDMLPSNNLEGVFSEWIEAGFAKFYRGKKVIWVRAKWKRAGKPSEMHVKGMLNHLENYPEVREDFLSYYKPLFNRIGTLVNGDSMGTQRGLEPHSNTDSDTDSEPEKKEKTLPDKSGGNSKPKKKAPDQPTAKSRQITDCYQKLYMEKFNKKPAWGKVEGKRIRELLERFEDDSERICKAIENAFESEDLFMSSNVGSFMTLTAAAVISKADTMGDAEWVVV